MNAWVLAAVIVLFFEGAMIGIAPDVWKRTMRQLLELPSTTLRKVGLAMSVVALALLFISFLSGH